MKKSKKPKEKRPSPPKEAKGKTTLKEELFEVLKQNKAEIQKSHRIALKKMAVENEKFFSFITHHMKELKDLSIAASSQCIHSLETVGEKIRDWEESFYYIFHNIKKNQYLYAHYPDDWVKEYLDIKRALEAEVAAQNKLMGLG